MENKKIKTGQTVKVMSASCDKYSKLGGWIIEGTPDSLLKANNFIDKLINLNWENNKINDCNFDYMGYDIGSVVKAPMKDCMLKSDNQFCLSDHEFSLSNIYSNVLGEWFLLGDPKSTCLTLILEKVILLSKERARVELSKLLSKKQQA